MYNASQASHLKKEIMIRLIQAFFSCAFAENTRLISYDMRPKGSEVPFRCCVYKERAVINDRVIAGLGFSIENINERVLLSEYAKHALNRERPESNPLTVLEAACKGCSPEKIHVTDLCQGCIARSCQSTCKFDAIEIVNGRSIIDPAKCKNCKICIPACPYGAIVKISVPCENSCPVDAIKKDGMGRASIDFDKCLLCGKCVSACPFGAVHEKSQIIDILKNMGSARKIVALVAPAIVGQFPGNLYQLKSAMINIGFDDVLEVAQGAEITMQNEAHELKEKLENNEPFMTTSCCAGYNQFVRKHLPDIQPFVSKTKTPLHYIAEKVKQNEPDAITVFISPCSAKRVEVFEDNFIDYVMNFEELGALFIAKKIEILDYSEAYFEKECLEKARNFAFSGGVAQAIESNFIKQDTIKSCILNGLNKENIKFLKKIAKEKKCDEGNFIEVMCCENGCIGGNATINNPKTAKRLISDFAKQKDSSNLASI